MNFIKKYQKLSLLLLAGALIACSGEAPLTESQLDTSVPPKTELDSWISANYLDPYNMEVLYKWNQNTVDLNRYLFPPLKEKVQPTLEVVKKIWLDSYKEVGGQDFVKKIAPRQILLVGGENYNTNGTKILGVAEAGTRITLFETDLLDTKNRNKVTQFIHTIQHEYIHILNQTKPFDVKAMSLITPSGYISSWYSFADYESQELGFISSYARSNVNEDFAETAAIILLLPKVKYEALINGITSVKAKADLRKKEAIVVKYFKDGFNMDFYQLRDAAERNTNLVVN